MPAPNYSQIYENKIERGELQNTLKKLKRESPDKHVVIWVCTKDIRRPNSFLFNFLREEELKAIDDFEKYPRQLTKWLPQSGRTEVTFHYEITERL